MNSWQSRSGHRGFLTGNDFVQFGAGDNDQSSAIYSAEGGDGFAGKRLPQGGHHSRRIVGLQALPFIVMDPLLCITALLQPLGVSPNPLLARGVHLAPQLSELDRSLVELGL
jgi:hypothetical protein